MIPVPTKPPPDLVFDPAKILSSVGDVVCVFDSGGRFHYVSPSVVFLLGYEPGELVGFSLGKFLIPEDWQQTLPVLQTPGLCPHEGFKTRFLHKTGRILPLCWSIRQAPEDGLLYCVARTCIDKLEVEQRLLKAQQMAKVANYEYDVVNDCYTYVSDTFFDLFHIDRSQYPQFTSQLFWDLVHPDDESRVRSNVTQMAPSYKPSLEYRMVRPDGSIVYVNRFREVICDKDGNPVRILGAIQDITDRKIGELALQRSEDRLRSLVQNGNDLVCILDTGGNYQYVGSNVFRHLGFTAEELTGSSAFALIHPDEQEEVLALLQKAAQCETMQVPPFRFRNKAGEWRWMESIVSNHLSNPSIGGFVVNSKDVTEKKEQQDQLQMLSRIAEEAPSCMLLIGLDHTITWANKAFLEMTELSLSQIRHKPIQEELMSEELTPEFYQTLRRALAKGETIRREISYTSPSGKLYWSDVVVEALYNDRQQAYSYLAIGKDITQRKLTELEKEEQEKRFRAMVKNGSDIIVVIDRHAQFSYCSDNLVSVLGYSRKELMGRSAFELAHPEEVPKLEQEIGALLSKPAVGRIIQHRFRHKNGHWLWLESRGTNHHSTESIRGILVNSRDITDRVHLQQILERETLTKQKEITSAVIRAQEAERSQLGLELHDNVNQILTTVKLYIEMYLTGVQAERELLSKSARYTQDCINEIRSISKRLSTPTLGSISLQDSVQELVDSINVTKCLEIIYRPMGIDGNCFSEDLHLAVYRIVQEGINNIIKYSQASIAIISIFRMDDRLYLRIRDNGTGFDTKAKRMGIGITNMKTRAENLNGTFCLQSEPGEGCAIAIDFPCEE